MTNEASRKAFEEWAKDSTTYPDRAYNFCVATGNYDSVGVSEMWRGYKAGREQVLAELNGADMRKFVEHRLQHVGVGPFKVVADVAIAAIKEQLSASTSERSEVDGE